MHNASPDSREVHCHAKSIVRPFGGKAMIHDYGSDTLDGTETGGEMLMSLQVCTVLKMA